MELTTDNVSKILKDSLFKDGVDTTNAVIVEGVRGKFGFDPTQLEKNKQHIVDMLSQLPNEFKSTGGGGWSFLQACMRSDDVQWGDHTSIDELICLGLAVGEVSFLMPRDMWSMFPGGMPYFAIK
jgi:hypothetical protein